MEIKNYDVISKNKKNKKIINKCLQRDPNKRPNANELLNDEVIKAEEKKERKHEKYFMQWN